MRKIERIMIVILAAVSMIVTVNAELLETTYNPPNFLIGYKGGYVETEDQETFYEYYLTPYAYDNENKISAPIAPKWANDPMIMAWNSYIEYDAIYKFSMVIEFDGLTEEPETGIVKNAGLYLYPADIFSEVKNDQIGQEQYVLGPDPSDYLVYDPATGEDNYHIFYDSTSGMLSAIFRVPEDWAQSVDGVTQFNNYIAVNLGNIYGSAVTVSTVTLESYTGLQTKEAYSQVLEEIKAAIEEMDSGGGGLTEEQVNQAIQDAMAAHDQQIEQDVNNQGQQADDIVDQLEEMVPSVKLQTALQGLTAAVSGNQRTCVLTLPEVVDPISGYKIMEQQSLDLTGTIQGIVDRDATIAALLDLVRWLNLLVLGFTLLRSIMNIITYVTSGGDQSG